MLRKNHVVAFSSLFYNHSVSISMCEIVFFFIAEHLLKVFPKWMDQRKNQRPRNSHPVVTHLKKTSVIQIPRAKGKLGESMSMRAMSRKLCR